MSGRLEGCFGWKLVKCFVGMYPLEAKEKLRKNEVEETHNSGSQKDPKERSKVGKNGGESE